MSQQPISTQPTSSLVPIDPTPIIQHGESPTAIILAVAILIAILFNSLSGLVRMIVILVLRQKKSS